LKCPRTDLYVHSKKELAPQDLQTCLQKIERRIQGEPVSYITNKKDFLNYTFFIQEGVLIPRPETELLVEYILHWIEEHPDVKNGAEKEFWTLDIGCGSGCIGISLLKEVFKMKMVSVDISEKAVETTLENAKTLCVLDKIDVLKKDADEMDYKYFDFLKQKGFAGTFDIVVSNPPYISANDPLVEKNVKKFEPHTALYCNDNGLEKIQKWTNLAGSILKDEGLWIFEIGASQGKSAEKIVSESGFFENIQVAQDYAGYDRFVIATKKRLLTNISN
jgi:release factor glutamine methyltransferase